MWAAGRVTPPDDAAKVRRILPLLDRAAAFWHALPVGGSLTYTWPNTDPEPTR